MTTLELRSGDPSNSVVTPSAALGIFRRPLATKGWKSWVFTVDHKKLGIMYGAAAIVFFIVVLAVVALRWYSKKKAANGGVWGFAGSKLGAIVAAVVLVVSAGAATWTMAQAGHQGAKLAWCEETHNC